MAVAFPDCQFVCDNETRLIHYHEMKNQGGKYFDANKAYFLQECKDEKLCEEIKGMPDYARS